MPTTPQTTLATCTADPLDKPKDVTTAVSEPVVGSDEVNVTTSDVGDETTTEPGTLLPPRLSATAVDEGEEVSKPVPAIVTEVAKDESVAELAVTVGALRTVATCTAAPLDSPKDVTDAESGSGLGCVAKMIVSDVVEAAEIEPTVPLLSVTTLPAAAGSKPDPAMTSVVWVELSVAELDVTVGAGGGPGGGGGEGPGGPGGLGLSETKTSPMKEVCGSPVIGSKGSAESGAAVTANCLF